MKFKITFFFANFLPVYAENTGSVFDLISPIQHLQNAKKRLRIMTYPRYYMDHNKKIFHNTYDNGYISPRVLCRVFLKIAEQSDTRPFIMDTKFFKNRTYKQVLAENMPTNTCQEVNQKIYYIWSYHMRVRNILTGADNHIANIYLIISFNENGIVSYEKIKVMFDNVIRPIKMSTQITPFIPWPIRSANLPLSVLVDPSSYVKVN